MQIRALSIFLILGCVAPARLPAQRKKSVDGLNAPISAANKAIAAEMLDTLQRALHDHYYDPTFHGVDMEKRAQLYKERIQAAQTLGTAYRMVAAYLSGLHDSHTFFLPPPRSYNFDYGVRMQMIGDNCYVTQVRPGSDAAAKLHPGDQVLALNGYTVTRGDFNDLMYALNALEPQGDLRLDVMDPQGNKRNVEVLTHFETGSRLADMMDAWQDDMQAEADAKLQREVYVEAGKVFVWKLPIFNGDTGDMNSVLSKAEKFPAIVLDLRDNPGGEVDMLRDLLGYFVDSQSEIAQQVGRKKQKPLMPKSHDLYPGKLYVLIDSGSASAAEIFARTVQYYHRGTILGDHSAGAVMESQIYPFEQGNDLVTVYGASITVDDLIMPDGTSLEGKGVTPDVVLLPTAADLAGDLDTVMSRAVAQAGGTLDPALAARDFPYRWAPLEVAH